MPALRERCEVVDAGSRVVLRDRPSDAGQVGVPRCHAGLVRALASATTSPRVAPQVRPRVKRRVPVGCLERDTSESVNLFVYGTLMDDTLVAALIGRGFRKEAAVLSGYRKMTPAGGYPYITPDASGVVEGFLLRDVDAEALRVFDGYEDEGRLYRRTEVIVSVGGREERAMVYAGVARDS